MSTMSLKTLIPNSVSVTRLQPTIAWNAAQIYGQAPARHTSSWTSPRAPRRPTSSHPSIVPPHRQLPHTQSRNSSHSPLSASTASSRKKISLQTLAGMYKRNEPITMITAHDFPSAHVADQAGMDMVLVGDSLAMVALGMEDTSEVTLDEMLLHCRSVSRGAKSPFVVGDMPMGSYEVSPEQAVATAIRFVKEGRVHAVKLEGGIEFAPTIAKITSVGIPVLAHIGLTPQRQNALGGFRVPEGLVELGASDRLGRADRAHRSRVCPSTRV